MQKAKIKKHKKFTTMMIVSGNEKSITTIRYPRNIPKIILASLIAFTMLVIGLTYRSTTLSTEYRVKLDNIKTLETINKQQQQEIDTLNLLTSEVKQKLKSLEEIEAKIKEMVGIQE